MSNEVGFKNKKSRFSANLVEIKSRCCFWILAFCGSIFPVVVAGCEILPENSYYQKDRVNNWASESTTIYVANPIKVRHENGGNYTVVFKVYGGTVDEPREKISVSMEADPVCNDVLPSEYSMYFVFFNSDKYLGHINILDAAFKKHMFIYKRFNYW